MSAIDERAGYITGLRQLADLLEQHDELPLPYSGNSASPLLFMPFGEKTRPVLAAFAKLMPATWAKQVRDDYFDLVGKLHGLHLQVIAHRDLVCERVVVGTEEVIRQVPDPSLPPPPMVEVTETVEVVEWRCAPLLAAARPDEPEPSTDPGDLERLREPDRIDHARSACLYPAGCSGCVPETDPAPQDGSHR